MTEPAGAKATSKFRRPGFLLEPLGWVQDRLTKASPVLGPKPTFKDADQCSFFGAKQT